MTPVSPGVCLSNQAASPIVAARAESICPLQLAPPSVVRRALTTPLVLMKMMTPIKSVVQNGPQMPFPQ